MIGLAAYFRERRTIAKATRPKPISTIVLPESGTPVVMFSVALFMK